MASIRRQVRMPLRFMDGYTTLARLLTFDGLVDGREHIALGLGRYADMRPEPAQTRPEPVEGPPSPGDVPAPSA